MSITLDEAVEATRTGDVWIFRGRTLADRAIQTMTNAPVNHVGMAVVLDDLPPLLWHAELGKSLRDLWTGDFHRGVQLHDLREAVTGWQDDYHQRAWLRQLTPAVRREHEDGLLRAIARLDGVSFPSTARLAWRWASGRRPTLPRLRRTPADPDADTVRPEMAYCAEVVAMTYEDMGLLRPGRRPSSYDPGTFWSGDSVPFAGAFALGPEIPVLPPLPEG